ncbi:hypothetical protein [Halocalculus aciditolerans]|uniref:Uncharacterized protein n=1 Tax=Halocalculus aciditolerans TaxID=1383812 RepID=A0A830F9A0_9EURY|nr:hypothetical protein [Halocalculus aciditolerans]GGL67136.1 hypothetical protein GCM10009039_26420 [Halocalculus aciditolerans]
MTAADAIDEVDQKMVTLTEAMLGYSILVNGEIAGAIEGVPGDLEHITVEMP